jgi:16S rRNA (guanine966-N2)-methyltransferase
MRVIAGQAKGRRLKSPGIGTRPMTDRMKESLFSALGDISGTTVLDLYAGSGSLGLEALSRGAKMATFVENSREAIVKLNENIEITGFDHASEVVWADTGSYLYQGAPDRKDLVFLDPPYSMSKGAVQGNLEELVTGGWLSDEGRIVVHRPAREIGLPPLGLRLVWDRSVGQSQLYVYEHEEDEG